MHGCHLALWQQQLISFFTLQVALSFRHPKRESFKLMTRPPGALSLDPAEGSPAPPPHVGSRSVHSPRVRAVVPQLKIPGATTVCDSIMHQT